MAHIKPAQEHHNRLQRAYYEDRDQAGNHRIMVRSTPYIDNHLDAFLRFSGAARGEAMLDVGCGMGKYSIPLAERGYRVEGLELSAKLLGELQSAARGRAEIRTHAADLLDPPPELIGAYDHVIGFFVLHHLYDLETAFRACARLLKPGGKVTFLEPNPFCPLFYVQIALSPSMSWAAERGMLRLTRKNTFQCLRRAGFEIPRLHRFGILPPFLRNRRGAAAVERGFDRIAPLRPVAAFQLIGAALAAESPSA